MNSFNEATYRIDVFDEKKIAQLDELYAVVYERKSPPSYFKKKYSNTYAGVSSVAFMAYSGEAPVAFIAAITCFIQYGDRKILTAQLVDGMTHPQHRSNGLYSNLCEKCFTQCKQKGIEVMFGFPNQDSYHPTLKLGWKLSGYMERFSISVQVSLFKKILNKLIEPNVNKILKDHITKENGLQSSVFKNGFYGVLRDQNYLIYKRYSNTYVLKIANSKVWISVKTDLIIGDIETDESDIYKMVEAIKKLASKLGCRVIHFQTCSEILPYKLFSSLFKSKPSFPVIFKSFNDDIDIKKIKFTFADIDIF